MSAIPYLTEDAFADRMQNELLPYIRARREECCYTAKDGTQLFVVLYRADAPVGSVTIVHGMGESSEKYHELTYYFLKKGLSVLLYDQRGHGRSTRKAPQGIIYVKSFSQYVSDLCEILAYKEADLPSPRYLFAHSMGGAVATLYLERDTGFFDKAFLSSPLVRVRIDGPPHPFIRAISQMMRLLGQGKKRLFVMSPPRHPLDERVEFASCASPARFEAYRAVKLSDERLHAAKPCYTWMQAGIAVTHKILAKGAPERIRIPVKICAAELDRLVEIPPQRMLASRIPSCDFHLFKGAKHELFNERDEICLPYFDLLLDFFS